MDSTTQTVGWLDTSTFTGSMNYAAEWNPQDYLWTIIFGFIVAFILAFAVGANDVANSFGTTVGAKVLTLRTACILASIFETLGALLIGAKVGETIRKGIIDVTIYSENSTVENGRELLMIGEVSAMSGAAIWQLIATVLGLPVSGTHSIVGACIGFSLVAVGAEGVNWQKLGMIIASWFISPVLAGIMAVSLYFFVKRYVLETDEPLVNGLRFLPFFYAFTFGINCFSILYTGAPLLGWNPPGWTVLLITLGFMLVIGIVVQFAVVPRLRNKAVREFGVDELNDKLTPLKRFPSDAASSSPSEKSKSKSGSNIKLNDSGYQTPCESRHKTNVNLNQSDFVSLGSEKADENFLQMENEKTHSAQISTTEKNLGPADDDTQKANLLSQPLNDSSSYDGGDSDSAFEEAMKKSPSKVKSEQSKQKEKEKEEEEEEEEEDPPVVRPLFSTLQILTACFGSFAHGGNDVSNAIGPLIALWLIYHSGTVVQQAATPWYLLLYGGVGIVAGLWILGRRVIKTIGSDLTKITPSSGFCIELMTALTVLIASNAGIPVSTTHCKVGSVVSIGWFRSRNSVTWSTVRSIALAWFVTVPVSGAISALVMYILTLIVR